MPNQKVVCILVIPEDEDAETLMDTLKGYAAAMDGSGVAWRSQDWKQAEEEGRDPTLLDQWEG